MKIKINNLKPGMILECKESLEMQSGYIAFTKGLFYEIKYIHSNFVYLLNNLKTAHILIEPDLNKYFSNPILKIGNKYECIKGLRLTFHEGQKYEYLGIEEDGFYEFRSENPDFGYDGILDSSGVLIHFGIDVSVKEGFDLDKMEKRLDDALAKETPESLTKWLEEKRATDTLKSEDGLFNDIKHSDIYDLCKSCGGEHPTELCYKYNNKQPTIEFNNDLLNGFNDGLHRSSGIGGNSPTDYLQKPEVKDLTYYKANAEEDYLIVPISVLRYITEMEHRIKLLEGEVIPDKEFTIQALQIENERLRNEQSEN